MKFSVSTYSLSGLVGGNGVTEKDLIKIAKEIGFEGIEFAEIHTPENQDKIEYAKELNEECKKHGIIPVQYSIGADFIYGSDGDIQKEIDRLKNLQQNQEKCKIKFNKFQKYVYLSNFSRFHRIILQLFF